MFAAEEPATDEDASSPSFEHLLAFVEEFNRAGRADGCKATVEEIRHLFSLYFSLRDQYDDHIETYKAQVHAKDKEIQALKSDLFYANETILHVSKELNSKKSSDSCPDGLTLMAVRGSKSVASEVAKVAPAHQMVPHLLHALEHPPAQPSAAISEAEKQQLDFIQSMHENHSEEIEGLHSTYREALEEIENRMQQVQRQLEQDLETK